MFHQNKRVAKARHVSVSSMPSPPAPLWHYRHCGPCLGLPNQERSFATYCILMGVTLHLYNHPTLCLWVSKDGHLMRSGTILKEPIIQSVASCVTCRVKCRCARRIAPWRQAGDEVIAATNLSSAIGGTRPAPAEPYYPLRGHCLSRTISVVRTCAAHMQRIYTDVADCSRVLAITSMACSSVKLR
jgi:hypothetical protein